MSSALGNLVRVNTLTVGTGAITYTTAVSGYKLPNTSLNGLLVSYGIEEPGGTPTDREVGRGILNTGAKTLTRASVLASTNSDALLNLSSGAAEVMIAGLAEDIPFMGTAILDFGAWPGAYIASVAVTGQPLIGSSSPVMANMAYLASADHTADEHLIDSLQIVCGSNIAGTGFTIWGMASTLLFGKYNVVWSYVV